MLVVDLPELWGRADYTQGIAIGDVREMSEILGWTPIPSVAEIEPYYLVSLVAPRRNEVR